MTRVYLPTPDYPPKRGGVARYLAAIAKSFPNVIVDYVKDGLTTTGWMSRLLRNLRTYDEVLVSHVLPVGTAAWLAQVYTRKPYVVIVHGMDFDLARRDGWKRFLTRQILRGARAIVANTNALADEVRTFTGGSPHVVTVYPSLTDELVEAEQITQRDQHAEIVLLTVGRLVERKGHAKVVQAMRDLPNVRYKIVGNGMERASLRALVKEVGVDDRVEFLDDVIDGRLPALYASADIFVMPTTKTATDREGFGIVYLEAQLFGLPVIATRQPGVDEAVRDGEGGLLIEDTPEALLAALRTLIADPALRARMGATGKAFVKDNFSRERQMAALAPLL